MSTSEYPKLDLRPGLRLDSEVTLHEVASPQLEAVVLVDSKPQLEEQLGNTHVNLLPLRQLVVCLLGCSVSLFVAFCDQTSVAIALPYISSTLNAENSINWAGTSSLLANTVCQVLFGRFADIFGRKEVLLASIAFLMISNMLCGFASGGPEFYVFRAMAGIGSGGITSMAMVIVSDVVTLEQRGKFQGILGTFVALGSALGPLIMAACAEYATWRDFFRVMPPVMAVIWVVVWFYVPSKARDVTLSMKAKFQKIDIVGIFFACAALIFLLIPISGGGSTYPWDSPLVIAMFVVGGVCFIVFFIVEATLPELPMIPLVLFKNYTLSILLLSTFLFGMAYYSFLFMVAYFFQLVQGALAMRSAVFFLPMVLFQSFMSLFAGFAISYLGHYYGVIIFGFAVWLTGLGMTLKWDVDTSEAYIVGTLILIGTGSGFTFQPSMVAAQAHSRKSQRAVVIGTRNVIRSFGGALGIAIATLIMSSSLLSEISKQRGLLNLPLLFLNYLLANIYSHPSLTLLTAAQAHVVKQMYATALRNYFYSNLPIMGIPLILSVFTKDNGLFSLDELPSEKEKTGPERV